MNLVVPILVVIHCPTSHQFDKSVLDYMQCQVREFCLHYGAGFSMTQDLANILYTDEEFKLQVVDKDNIFVPPGLDRPNLIGKAKKPEEKQQEKDKPKINSV